MVAARSFLSASFVVDQCFNSADAAALRFDTCVRASVIVLAPRPRLAPRGVVALTALTVRVLDVRTKVWSTVDDTTLKAHWRRPRGPQYGFPEDLDQYDPEPTVHDETTIRLLDTEDRVGGPTLRTGGKRPASFPVISYRGDFAVFETAGDEDYAYQASPDEWEDMDTPAIYVLTGGNTWIPTGGRLGCTASRELYKSRGELFPDVYHVAAPPAWLQEMPVCLTQPWYSTWTDGAYEGTDYGRYASRMSHIESGRFCVVKA